MPYILKELFPAFQDLDGGAVRLSDEEFARFQAEYVKWNEIGTPEVGFYTSLEDEQITLPFATLPALKCVSTEKYQELFAVADESSQFPPVSSKTGPERAARYRKAVRDAQQ